MSDRPILFSGPMVRALLAGTKTQTRRVFKLPTKGIYERKDMGGWAATTNGGGNSFTIARDGTRTPAPETVGIWHQTTGRCLNAPYQAGDRLYVREVCRAEELASGQDGVRYIADDAFDPIANTVAAADRWSDLFHYGGKRPSGMSGRNVPGMHMPRWASRLTLTVTEVRVQRLQEISEEDAEAEGIERISLCGVPGGSWKSYDPKHAPHVGWVLAVQSYQSLWNSLNDARGFGWDANPWVVAVSFTVERRNIDA